LICDPACPSQKSRIMPDHMVQFPLLSPHMLKSSVPNRIESSTLLHPDLQAGQVGQPAAGQDISSL
jgi:hypothetical protein